MKKAYYYHFCRSKCKHFYSLKNRNFRQSVVFENYGRDEDEDDRMDGFSAIDKAWIFKQ